MPRTEAPKLLPLFRSEGQGRLLARVYLSPDRPQPVSALSRELGLDAGGVTREADRLERAGLVVSERVGRQRLLRPNPDSPYYRDLRGLLLTAFGPASVIGPALAAIAGVERAFIYGSWAARYHGETGPDPADIDVLVVGEPSRREVARAALALTETLGREVNPVIVTSERWDDAAGGFLREVQSRPLVELDLGREASP